MNSLALSRLVKLKNLLFALPVLFGAVPAVAQHTTPVMANPGRLQRLADEIPSSVWFRDTAFVGPVPSEDSLKVLDQYFAWRRTPEGGEWAK